MSFGEELGEVDPFLWLALSLLGCIGQEGEGTYLKEGI